MAILEEGDGWERCICPLDGSFSTGQGAGGRRKTGALLLYGVKVVALVFAQPNRRSKLDFYVAESRQSEISGCLQNQGGTVIYMDHVDSRGIFNAFQPVPGKCSDNRVRLLITIEVYLHDV